MIKEVPQSHTADQPRHLEEETHNNNSRIQSNVTSSLFPSEMIAKLETTLSNAQQNKDQTQNPYKQWEQQ